MIVKFSFSLYAHSYWAYAYFSITIKYRCTPRKHRQRLLFALYLPCSSEALERLINKRIGIDLFQEKLEALSKSECYGKALQKPQLRLSIANDMILDYEFARLYKALEGSIARSLNAQNGNATGKALIDPLSTNLYEQQTSTMMSHYNDLIRQQDQQLNTYKQQEKQSFQETDMQKRRIGDLEQQLQEIKDQYSLLKISTKQGELQQHGDGRRVNTTCICRAGSSR